MATPSSSGGMLSGGGPVLTTLLRSHSPQQTPLRRHPCLCCPMHRAPIAGAARRAGRRIHSQGWDPPLPRLLGAEEEAAGREGRRRVTLLTNLNRLNRLLGAVQAEPMPSLILKSGAIHHQRTGSFHGKLKRATLKGRGKNLSKGRANQSVAGVVWRGMLSTPDSDSLPRGAVPLPGRVQSAGGNVSPGRWEDSGHGDALGFVGVWQERWNRRGRTALVCTPAWESPGWRSQHDQDGQFVGVGRGGGIGCSHGTLVSWVTPAPFTCD